MRIAGYFLLYIYFFATGKAVSWWHAAVRMWLWPRPLEFVHALVDKVDEGNAGKEKLGWHAIGFPVKLLIRWWISGEPPLQFINRLVGLKVCGCYSVSFHVLQLLLVRFTKWNLCCIRNLSMIWLWLLEVHFFIPYKNIYVFSFIFIFACGIVNKIWKCNLVSFEHMSLWCFCLDPHRITHELNIGVELRKRPNNMCVPHL